MHAVSTCAVVAATVASYASAAPVLYGFDNVADALITIDPNSGATTTVGSLGYSSPVGVNSLTYSSDHDLLFSVEIISDELITIDPATGLATSVGSIGFNDVVALQYDSSSGVIFGYTTTGQFLSVDPNTGQGTHVGNLGVRAGRGMTFNANGNLVFFSDRQNLHTIDATTGTATAVPNAATFGPSTGFEAIAFNPLNGTLLAAEDPFNPQIFTLDGTTAAFQQGFLTGTGQLSALEFVVPSPGTALAIALTGAAVPCRRRRSAE